MEGYGLVDIYSTKGIEYLIAAVFFFGFLALQRYILTSSPGGGEDPGIACPLAMPPQHWILSIMEFPGMCVPIRNAHGACEHPSGLFRLPVLRASGRNLKNDSGDLRP